MNIPIRLENAITKLYTAFHNNELDAMKKCHCAVGNILDNSDIWYTEENFTKSGYSKTELHNIESFFMYGVGYGEVGMNWNAGDIVVRYSKDYQFKGLCEVIEYLCELDNIPNVMDYTKLFETENEQPKYELPCKTL